MENMNISIILPVYNEELYIRRTLSSLKNQTYPNYEAIIVDDYSSDDTCSIITEFARGDSRFRLIRNDRNMGAPRSRNRGMSLAGGEYIVFLDADDCFEPDFLERLYYTAVSIDADVVACKSHIVNAVDQDVRVFGQWRRLERLMGDESLMVLDDPSGYPGICSLVDLPAWNKLIRRRHLVDHCIKFQEIDSYNDLSFSFLSCLLASRLAFLNECLITYYQYHSGGITNKRAKGYCPIVPAYDAVIRHKVIQQCNVRDELINRAIHNVIAVALMEGRSPAGRGQILEELCSKVDHDWIPSVSSFELVIDPACRFGLEFIRSHTAEDISIDSIERYIFKRILEIDGTQAICVMPGEDEQRLLSETLRVAGDKRIIYSSDNGISGGMKVYRLRELWI